MLQQIGRRTLLRGFAAAAAGTGLLGACAGVRRGRIPAFDADAARPLGIQLYMLGDEPFRDPGGTFARLAELGFREAELPQVPKDSPAFAAAAAASGIRLSSLHLGSGRLAPKGLVSLDSEAGVIADALATLGIRQVVLSLMPVPDSARFGSGRAFGAVLEEAIAAAGPDYWKRLAEFLNRRALDLRRHGIALGYHNHNIEFAPTGGSTGFDLLVRHCDPGLVHFELDIGWAVSAGRDPVALINSLSGRIRQLHLKDVASGTTPNFRLETKPAIIGTGIVDWLPLLAAARSARVRHAYVEQEPPFAGPRWDAARESAAYLESLRL